MLSRLIVCLLITVLSSPVHAGWFDWLSEKSDEVVEAVKSGDTSKMLEVALTNEQIANGLKQALKKGADYAVTELGEAGGFLNDPQIKIPMPEKLKTIEKILRKTGQEKYADQFVNTMNRAAEQATPMTLNIIKQSISDMTLEDAQAILKGHDHSATDYLKRVSSEQLRSEINPLVKQATAQTGITKVYKKMYKKMGFAGEYLKLEDYDIDQYITAKTLDGLFIKIAAEEKKIRDNPAARTTDVLKQVFGG